jgi:hypothetical protein
MTWPLVVVHAASEEETGGYLQRALDIDLQGEFSGQPESVSLSPSLRELSGLTMRPRNLAGDCQRGVGGRGKRGGNFELATRGGIRPQGVRLWLSSQFDDRRPNDFQFDNWRAALRQRRKGPGVQHAPGHHKVVRRHRHAARDGGGKCAGVHA